MLDAERKEKKDCYLERLITRLKQPAHPNERPQLQRQKRAKK